MPNLFDELGQPAGYRLKLLEVFNWGTFHEGSSGQDIWRLVPDGQNTLLTGVNGSGKTTLVDGLLALLVNPKTRFFNQSAGAESKAGRTPESYVEGHYGNTQDEAQQRVRPEKLRPNRAQTYSILLGVFTNAQSLPITLVQVRWFNASGLQQKYLVAKAELNIAAHIRFGTANQWVSGLKKQFAPGVVEEFDTFAKYAAVFQRLFGMREKALTLFSQTVSMKVVADLDSFIRANMLAESTAEKEFEKLMDSYTTLLVSYRALEKARTQLGLLRPVYELSHAYETLHRALRQTAEQQRLLEPWFARQQLRLWAAETSRLDRELDRLTGLLGQQEAAWDTADAQRVRLSGQIDNDTLGREIKDLERDIRDLEKSKASKERDLKEYNRLARQLELVADPDAGVFEANRTQAAASSQQLVQLRQQLKEQDFSAQTARDARQKEHAELEIEVAQLLSSTGKVTGRSAAIRQEILAAVGATESEIPFVAELIQVKPGEKAVWNNALEKLLHSFGRNLLVPAHLYPAVTAYVHQVPDLKGKIVYHRVDDKAPRPLLPDARTVAAKLDFNPQSRYADWVENEVARRFNYVCTEERATFERAEKAVLPSGLVRHGSRHERDDTAAQRHILGWDNGELLRECQRRGRELNTAIEQAESSLRRIAKELEKAALREKNLDALLGFPHFFKLDWAADALKMAELTTQKSRLESESASLQLLKTQLTALTATLAGLGKAKDDTRDETRETERTLAALKAEQQEQERILKGFESADLADLTSRLAEWTAPLLDTLTYARFFGQKKQLEQQLTDRLATLDRDRETQEKRIREAMRGFLMPGATVLATFADWQADLGDLRPEVEQLPAFVDRYEQIKHEELAELEARFRDEFNRGVTRALTDYCHSLEVQHEAICDTMAEINKSLRDIDFGLDPPTYIELVRLDSRQPKIRDFRENKLDSWKPDLTQLALAADPKEAELAHFVAHIQPFITELQAKENEQWRQDVTDVRNWSSFRAQEYFRADKAFKQAYESTTSLSGGEGAQLAYTVLGAAIAHQFGIGSREVPSARSFRFIVIDEAFSKLDEDKSKYLLQLCQRLGLQLMVVTPATSLHLLEKDVQVIHWVTKAKQDKRKSVVMNIPIRRYEVEKEALLADATAPDDAP